MHVEELFEKIRETWLAQVAHRLAKGEGVLESFLQQLSLFYDSLVQAVVSGDPQRLDSLLADWIEARTQTELETSESSISPILEHILLETFAVARDALSEKEALELTGAVLPVYAHAFKFAIQKEAQLYIDHVSRNLEVAKDTLERLDKSKSDFIAIAAHELKTPLTLIEGYSSMLREQLSSGEDQAHTRVLLKGMDNGARRLREIVDDMIDVSMIDNHLLSLHFQPVWINRLLKVIQHEFADSVAERNQTLKIRSFPGSNEMTFGDEERLYQAFRNVISNAIKYTPDGGKITVDGRKLPGFLEITVADTGIGIDPEDQARIFEKFGRVGSVSLHSSGKTKFKGGGPGLGLPITKGIIDAHGGAIWAESLGYDEERCPGTVFHIMLPLLSEPPDDKTARLFGPIGELPANESFQTGD